MLQELDAKNKKESLKKKLFSNPSLETVKAYFDNEAVLNSAQAKIFSKVVRQSAATN